MPQSGGIRSYQTVNDGTDDQFVCEQIFELEVINIFILDFIWIFPIGSTNSYNMDIYCFNCWISSSCILLETSLVSSMLLHSS
jgi:hypothetical protein